MSDLEERLRNAIDSSVEGAEPSFDVIDAVRRRHRRRLIRVIATSAATVMAVIAAAVLLGLPHRAAPHPPAAAKTNNPNSLKLTTPVFPGGGRLLLANGGGLEWLYPGGRAVQIAGDFDGARVSGGELLAWKYTSHGPGYYTMKLNGSQQRLVLPAERNKLFDDIQAQLSPDGSRLAYIRQQVNALQGRSTVTSYTLWVLDLATGQRVDLGPVSMSAGGSSLAWRDDITILVTSADAKALLLVNAVTRSRSTYLAVTDPALISAYEQARPGAGPPAYISSDGWRGHGTASHLAVWLAAASRTTHPGTFPQATAFTRPAEIVLAGTKPLVTYAPETPQQLSLTWGPNGLVLLTTGAGDNPGSWNTYAATLQSDRLSQPMPYGGDGAIFNPAGNVIALQDSGLVTFVSTPRPACRRTARCVAFQPTNLLQPGTVQAWAS
jgi:hypothetical protein